ncbi:MAG: hypothetical protein AAB332_02655, partial [Planctomycetota bacterium]
MPFGDIDKAERPVIFPGALPEEAFRVFTSLPVSISQMVTTLSTPPDNAYLSSGEKIIEKTYGAGFVSSIETPELLIRLSFGVVVHEARK